MCKESLICYDKPLASLEPIVTQLFNEYCIMHLSYRRNYSKSLLDSGIATSKTPVPLKGILPNTMLLEGLRMVSKSPYNAASVMNVPVVSNEALRNGEVLFERPVRLKGL